MLDQPKDFDDKLGLRGSSSSSHGSLRDVWGSSARQHEELGERALNEKALQADRKNIEKVGGLSNEQWEELINTNPKVAGQLIRQMRENLEEEKGNIGMPSRHEEENTLMRDNTLVDWPKSGPSWQPAYSDILLTASPVNLGAQRPNFSSGGRKDTGQTLYGRSLYADNESESEIKEEGTQKKGGKNPEYTRPKNPITFENIAREGITPYNLYRLHKHYQAGVQEASNRGDHLPSSKSADNEIEVIERKNTNKYTKYFMERESSEDVDANKTMSRSVADMESELKLSENFRKKGQFLGYMVKRADGNDLDTLADLTVAHLKKLALIPDEKIPDIWDKVREFYGRKRFEGLGKVDEEKFITLKRYIERQRVNENNKCILKRIWGRASILSSYIVVGSLRFWITKRELKQELAKSFGLEQERYDFLKEKEARKSNTKLDNFIREKRGLRPHNQRIERLRGRYGKEQGELGEIIRFKEKYQHAIDGIRRFQRENDSVYKRIEQHVLDFCKRCKDQERANEAFAALAVYKMVVTKEGERLNLELNKLHLQFQAEIQGAEKRIKAILEKVSWNDFFSIGYGPAATTAGTVLTVLPFAGVAV